MSGNNYPHRADLDALPEVVVRKNSAEDLIQTINAYQGERDIIVPRCSTPLTINEKIAIQTEGTRIIGKPAKMAEIRLGPNGYLSVENAQVMDSYGVEFNGLNITGTGGATRGISTENMGAGKRLRFLKILNCVLFDFDVTNAIPIRGKNPELWEIAGCRLSQTKTALIDLYNDGYAYGNVWIHNNFFLCHSGVNAGIGLRVRQVDGNAATIISRDNQYWADALALDSIAIEAVVDAGYIGAIKSFGDRFEGVRAFHPTVTGGGTVRGLNIEGANALFNGARDTYIVELSAACIRAKIIGNTIERGGSNKIVGVRNDNISIGNYRNHCFGNTFQYFNEAISGSLYVEQGTGGTMVDEHNIYTA